MGPLRRLLPYLKPYWRPIALGFFCLVLATPASLFHPLVWMFVVDKVIVGGRHGLLLPALAVMAGVHLLSVGLGALRTYILGLVGQKFVTDLRLDLYRKIQAHSLEFFHQRRSGDLIARVIGDVDVLQQAAVNGVVDALANALQFVVVACVIVVMCPLVGVLTLLPMIGVVLLVYAFNSRVRGLYRRIRDRLGDVSAKLGENLSGILVIKSFAREPHEQERFEAENVHYQREAVRGVLASAVYFPAVFTIGFVSSIVMLGVGAWAIWPHSLTIGGLVALGRYWWQLFFPVQSLAQINEMLQRANAAAGRVFEVLDAPPEITDLPAARDLGHAGGRLTLENVTFAYVPGRPVIRGLDVEVLPGQKLGIVGPSGAGKSTLLSLLMRFYDPEAGRVLLDQTDIRELKQASLRRHMAIVTQEPFLFNDTVQANILYGRLGASAEEAYAAARQANAHDFILGLPRGYQTVTGERGVRLSGGQKQRLCIARAFLADPRILLLDEATAAVEPETEALIQAALERLMLGRTTVIVSHRLSMVRDCDLIVVIERERIAERGRHDELMSRGGWYARMYRLQMGLPPGEI
jgi:ABC-type multidrug transport system fused ATPase/permease subunit